MNRLPVQDLDEIFRSMRTRSEGRLRLNRRRSKKDLAPWLPQKYLSFIMYQFLFQAEKVL